MKNIHSNIPHQHLLEEFSMKKLVFILVLFWIWHAPLEAQSQRQGIAVDFKQVSVFFEGNPKGADPLLHPLIGAKRTTGGKEVFGIGMGTGNETVLELLDKNGAVVKSLSSGELLGEMGIGALVAGEGNATSRRMEMVSTVNLPNGKVQIFVRALATGDAKTGSHDQHLVVTLGLKASAPMSLALRVSWPVIGVAGSGDHGFVIITKSGSAALCASVYPDASDIAVEQGKVVLASNVLNLDGTSLTPALWLVIDGVSAPSLSAVKLAAQQSMKDHRYPVHDPHVVVVSAADKLSSQPGDIVTYMVACANIGSSAASNVALNNPIPAGTQYLEGSATSGGGEVSIDRTAVGVRKISWTFPTPLRPGAERVVAFKVRVL